MKKVYLILSVMSCLAMSAQTFEWAKAEGEDAYDYGYGIDCDNQGNVYVAGKYEHNQANFSGIKVGCEGNHDGFLCKYGADGAIKWVRTFGGTGGDYSQALYCDKTNYVYTAGEIEANTAPNLVIKFSGTTTTVLAKSDNDIVVAKYDLDGNLIWAKAEGANNSEKALGVCADKDGNVLICGYYDKSTIINGTSYTGKGGRDIFVAKFDKNGNFLWFRDAGSAQRDEAKAVKVDSDGNVYLCGIYNDNCTFGSNTLYTYHNSAYWDAFVAKYDPSGTLLWVKTAGGDVTDGAWSMTVDNSKNVYISGEFAAYAVFSPDVKHHLTARGPLADTYVAKYNTNGDLQWVKGAGSDKDDRARGLGTDGTYIFITGQFGGSAQFGGAWITAGDTSDIYIAALDSDGLYKWALAVGGTKDAFEDLGYESGNAVNGFASGSNGAVYATGGLLDNGSFGSHVVGTNGTRTNAFVTKISWDTGMPSIPEGLGELTNQFNIGIYPNPASGNLNVDLSDVVAANVEINVYNYVGQIVASKKASGFSKTSLDLSNYAEGIFLVEVRADNSVVFRNKLIVKH